jgi:hypothetical protein
MAAAVARLLQISTEVDPITSAIAAAATSAAAAEAAVVGSAAAAVAVGAAAEGGAEGVEVSVAGRPTSAAAAVIRRLAV